jgi:mannose-6-phosphate isomerase
MNSAIKKFDMKYQIKNIFLRNIMNQIVEKPWGYEIIWAKTPKYVGKVLVINAGESLSLQYHKVKDETLFLESGEVDLIAGNHIGELSNVPFSVGETFHVAPGVIHRMTAKKNSRVFEVSTPELEDVVRLNDEYGRANNDNSSSSNNEFKMNIESVFKKNGHNSIYLRA